MPIRLKFNLPNVVLSPASRKRFLELSREEQRLRREHVNLTRQLRSRHNLTRNQRAKMEYNAARILAHYYEVIQAKNAYHISSPRVREAELANRKARGSNALAWIASRRPALTYYKGAHNAEKLLAQLQKQWNVKYGPANSAGRRRGSPNKNFALLVNVNATPKPRSPRVKTASPTRARSAKSPRTRSAPAVITAPREMWRLLAPSVSAQRRLNAERHIRGLRRSGFLP